MRVDIPGRVANMQSPSGGGLAALYEAVVNSIQAVQEKGYAGGGTIDIEVLRDSAQLALEGSSQGPSPVVGFVITDNGIGFNDANFDAFNTSDTTYKRALGGKGVGRFLWLKVFDHVKVRSVFEQNGGRSLRTFRFAASDEGIADYRLRDAAGEPVLTVVELVGLRDEFRGKCPRRLTDIADAIIQHCLEYLVLGSCPDIHLRDDTDSPVHLNARFQEVLLQHQMDEEISVRAMPFRVRHVRLGGTRRTSHALHYCAHMRVVKSMDLLRPIPELAARPEDGRARFAYAAYVSAEYLDANVSADRTDFGFPRTREQETMYEVCEDELSSAVIEHSRAYLGPWIEPVREMMGERVRRYVETEAPGLRHVLTSRPAEIRSIPPGIRDDELEVRLCEIDYDVRRRMKEDARKIIQASEESPDLTAEADKVLAAVNDVTRSDLARYIVHRKLILELLDKSLGLKPDGTYSRERDVHRIIYPMGATSDSLEAYERQNLWIVDERLSYHSYLASDKPMVSMEPVNTPSRLRPDIAIFNKGLAYADGEAPYPSIVILEFKRPVREQYDEDEYPLAQVYAYIREMRGGALKDGRGRPMEVAENASFYVYIIADMTPALIRQAEDNGFRRTPDGRGYFGYNENHCAYVEIVSYTKLIADAKKRNRVLFEKLNLPLSTR